MFVPLVLTLLAAEPTASTVHTVPASATFTAPPAAQDLADSGAPRTRGPLALFTWADFDGDGFVDAFVIQPDGEGHLLRNLGDGSFEEQTDQRDLVDAVALTDAAWTDFDADGLADLIWACPDGPLRLWRQTDDGTFMEVARSAGLAEVEGGLEVEWRDLDGDGRADLRVSTLSRDRVFQNLRDGSFVEVDLSLDPRPPFSIGAGSFAEQPESVRVRLESGGPSDRAGGASGPGGGTHAPGGAVTGGGTASGAGAGAGCAGSIDDMAAPGICIPAATVPTLGALYPLSSEFNVDPATGWIAVNTLIPDTRFHVVGQGRFQGDDDLSAAIGTGMLQVLAGDALTGLGIDANEIQSWGSDLLINDDNLTGTTINSTVFVTTDGSVGINRLPGAGTTLDVEGTLRASDTIVSTKPSGAPFAIASADVIPNLNADLLDGLDSTVFSQFGTQVDTAELADSAVTDAKVAGGILGAKIIPDFGAQDITTSGRVVLGADYGGQFNLLGDGRMNGDWDLQGKITALDVDTAGFRLVTGASAGRVLVSDPSGNGSWQDPGGGGGPDSDWFITGNDMYSIVSGNVGIGTSTPDTKLNISGGTDASATGGGYLQIGNDTSSNVVIDSNEIMGRWNGGATDLFLQNEGGGLNVFSSTAPGLLGVGTTSPLARLHVETMTGGTEDALRVRVEGNTKLIVQNDGDVGIGGSAPNYPFHVWADNPGDYAAWVENADAADGMGLRVHTQGSGAALVAGTSGGGDIINGRGSSGVVFSVTNTGRVVTTALEITGGGDLVEAFDAREGEVEPGSVMSIDPLGSGGLTLSSEAYDRKVAGIVSGAGGVKHGIQLVQEGVLGGDTLLAMTGRVWCKCSTENGVIRPGDRLTTASLLGHGMKATDETRSPGAVIGKAMTSLDEDTGLVLVLVNLQ